MQAASDGAPPPPPPSTPQNFTKQPQQQPGSTNDL